MNKQLLIEALDNKKDVIPHTTNMNITTATLFFLIISDKFIINLVLITQAKFLHFSI
jgi:hypothetical protein